jgi:hypothetical protein
MGKTTLLRAISDRELKIPNHITILHVEQEVDGDETLAIDAVLQADVERVNSYSSSSCNWNCAFASTCCLWHLIDSRMSC